MVKVVSFINMKGGVGKTTLAVNIAYCLSWIFEKSVLLVDIDPQFNATQYLVSAPHYVKYIEDEEKCTIMDIFREKPLRLPKTASKGDKIARPEPTLENSTINIVYSLDGSFRPRLDLIPSNLELMVLEISERGTEYRLARFLEKVKGRYDYVLIDCPPTTSIYTKAAFLASDALLIPVKTDHLSSIGLPLLDSVIEKYEHDYAHKVEKLGIVFNMVNKAYNLDKKIMRDIKNSGRPVFENNVRRSTTIARAVENRQAIFRFRDSKISHGPDIINITKEFLVKLGDNIE